MKMLPIAALALLALAACSKGGPGQAAGAPSPAPAAQASAAGPQFPTGAQPGPAGAPAPGAGGQDATKECASYGLAQGTSEYNDCVKSMTEANQAASGAGAPADATHERADMQADMERQRAEMQKQMHDAQNAPASSGCVTTHNGTNTSTVCP